MRSRLVTIGIAAFWLTACSKDDATLEKQLVGIWECEPRTQLPPDQIDDSAFVTASFVAIQFRPGSEGGGEYVHVRKEPKSMNEPERFIELRGTWYVASGRLHMSSKEKWDVARRKAEWEPGGAPRQDDHDARIVKLEAGQLQLQTERSLSLGSACRFHRGSAMPARPELTTTPAPAVVAPAPSASSGCGCAQADLDCHTRCAAR